MNEDNSILSPQPQATPVQKSELENLSPNGNFNAPSTTRNFPVSDPNLKPLEVNLPKDIPAQNQPLQTPSTSPTAQPTQIPATPPTQPLINPTPKAPLPVIPIVQEQPQVFVNPNPAVVQPEVSGIPTAGNPFGLNQNLNNNLPPQTPTRIPVNPGMPTHHFNFGMLLLIILIVALLGGGGFALNEFVLNKITNLSLVSENAQFYLTLAVKQNPQAVKAKATIKKFPGGDQVLKQFDKYYTQFTGTDPNNVLNDLTQYANTELLFARESRATDNTDTSQRLINIVDTGSPKKAQDGINNFSDDTATYKVTNDIYKGITYSDIKLLSEQKLYEEQIKNSTNLKYSLSTPKPQSRIAVNIDKFIFSSDKVDDVKMAVDLSQAKKVFGIATPNSPKSILDASDHQKMSSLFPKETFVRYFARDPITPYSSFSPFFGASLTTSANAAETEANDFQKTTRGIDSYFTDDGLKVDTYALDNSNSQNSFAIDQSLATRLPQKFAGVAPTLYAETQNLQAQWKKQIDFATTMKDSKSRSQRDQFTSFLDSADQMKTSYLQTYGIDYETDVLSWLDGQIGFVFSAGKTKKGPEFLVIAETKNTDKADSMVNKIKIPSFSTPSYSYDANGKLHYTMPTESIKKFTKSTYKDSSIYSLALPEYSGIKYSYYFGITKTKIIFGVSDSDQAIKDTIDFESNPTADTLAKNSNWQKQFSSISGNVNDIAFAEPVNLMGLMDYAKSVYPQYNQLAASYSGVSSTYLDDIEKIANGYLKTIPSIGAVAGQNKDVSYSKIFVNIVEIPSAEKKDAEDALGRLLQTDTSNQYKSVLGINSETTFSKAQKDFNNFFNTSLKPIFDPQNILQ